MDQSNPTDLAERPIDGRRLPIAGPISHPSLCERKLLAAVVLALAATVLSILGALAVWNVCAQWRLGWIELTSDGPPLTAQVLPESGDAPLGEPFHVLNRSTVALPEGDYRLRVHRRGTAWPDLPLRREPG